MKVSNMNKAKVFSITGIIVGLLAGLYSFLGLYMIALLSGSPGYTTERKQANVLLWLVIFWLSLLRYLLFQFLLCGSLSARKNRNNKTNFVYRIFANQLLKNNVLLQKRIYKVF
jgi:hypothetical protein